MGCTCPLLLWLCQKPCTQFTPQIQVFSDSHQFSSYRLRWSFFYWCYSICTFQYSCTFFPQVNLYMTDISPHSGISFVSINLCHFPSHFFPLNIFQCRNSNCRILMQKFLIVDYPQLQLNMLRFIVSEIQRSKLNCYHWNKQTSKQASKKQ